MCFLARDEGGPDINARTIGMERVKLESSPVSHGARSQKIWESWRGGLYIFEIVEREFNLTKLTMVNTSKN